MNLFFNLLLIKKIVIITHLQGVYYLYQYILFADLKMTKFTQYNDYNYIHLQKLADKKK